MAHVLTLLLLPPPPRTATTHQELGGECRLLSRNQFLGDEVQRQGKGVPDVFLMVAAQSGVCLLGGDALGPP
jgi:hypothetical protein